MCPSLSFRLSTTDSDYRMGLNNSPLTYIVCNHDWSFLEGEKKHSHTLKAGRHFFPFQLQLGGSLPSSIFTSVQGGASVSYKLRAHAVRPGLAHNLQAVIPVTIIRSFAAEALEYQQTLEIENTWPEKLMYSIMIPHKAWAAGDTLTALTKFSPLAKGVTVLNINTSIHETTKVYSRSGYQEQTRVVAAVRHEIARGKALEVQDVDLHPPSRLRTPGTPGGGLTSAPPTPAITHTNVNRMALSGSYFATADTTASSAAEAGSSSNSEDVRSPGSDITDEDGDRNTSDIVTHLNLNIPVTITPTHGLDPIIVTHRIRWSILILNLDGHTSELRCSLPLHLLDYHLLDEARMHTVATRRLLVGGDAEPPQEDDDMELPSYTAHVRDRVANMFLPEAATMRVTNPWVQGGVSPTVVGVGQESNSPWPRTSSGASSPLEAHLLSHFPHQPGSGDSTPLDWVNSELLLSLSETSPPQLSSDARSAPHHIHSPHRPPSDHTDSTPTSRPESGPTSRFPSRGGSRATSRAPSPERAGHAATGGLHVAGAHETYVHSGNNASRHLGGVFKASLKPFTSIPHPGWLSRSSSHNNVPTLVAQEQQRARQHQAQRQQSSSSSATPSSNSNQRLFGDPNSGTALLHRAFTEVPDYQMASRGFIGGVPPLSSMQGLPSYDESSASGSSSPNANSASPSPASR